MGSITASLFGNFRALPSFRSICPSWDWSAKQSASHILVSHQPQASLHSTANLNPYCNTVFNKFQRSPVGSVVKRITSNDKITGSIPVRGM
ncbi:unnamed protein product [Fusarium graminearum]|uniref:Chromosome 2, complete genome n=1 Tax=Gibberella zeae (strain ATCC MYA-4620 / CBS 123657 / FGSC 9075 / NRRL 31084 / PH-1) TaxID=229533 RepID=A0A098DCY2_GIBZE|nr:unnamed protein product [Fusarium graminearum]CZS80105.1 unnamed protein product [Fusarium graminearum]